jgi:iron complex outermembrane receptor protein
VADSLLSPHTGCQIFLGFGICKDEDGIDIVPTNAGTGYIDTEVESSAVYVQTTFAPTEKLSLTTGIRYSEDFRAIERFNDEVFLSFYYEPGENEISSNHIDYTLATNFQFTDDVMGYIKASTGYRAGGIGERIRIFDLPFKEETNITYELGLKSEIYDNRIRINAAVFSSTYDDLLVTFPGTNPKYVSINEVANAGEAGIDGVELDAVALIGNSTTLSVNYAYLTYEIKDAIYPENSWLGTAPEALNDYKAGDDITDLISLPFVPEHAFTVMLDHSWYLGEYRSLDLNVHYNWRDSVTGSAILQTDLESTGALGARLGLSGLYIANSKFKVSLWAKNITDEDNEEYNLTDQGHQYREPRTFGVDISMEL